MRRIAFASITAALVLASGLAVAQSGGGCLQGTWVYYNASNRVVGSETVGCGSQDGLQGTRTSRSAFTPGCASAF